MNELEQLKKENADLRYQIKKYESVLCGTCRGAGTVLISIDDGMDCPECAQHLADIKADAVIALTEQDYGYSVEIGGNTDEWVISVDQILAYANKLRGESK